jgi:hypothetical protein
VEPDYRGGFILHETEYDNSRERWVNLRVYGRLVRLGEEWRFSRSESLLPDTWPPRAP